MQWMLAEESQSDEVIGFAPKVLLVKKGSVDGLYPSKAVHTESSLSSPLTSVCPSATSSSSSPPSFHLPPGPPRLAWLFSAILLHLLARQ